MTSRVTERLHIRHSPDDIYRLIGDVRSYPRFISLISALRVTDTQEIASGRILTAEAVARYKMVSERFVTRVTLDDAARTIVVNLIKGPFKSLVNCWKIQPLSDGSSLVDFDIKFEFSNPMLNMLLNANKDRAISMIIRAFEAEADRLFTIVGDESVDLSAEIKTLDGIA